MRRVLRFLARFAFICGLAVLFAICPAYFIIPTAIVVCLIAGVLMIHD